MVYIEAVVRLCAVVESWNDVVSCTTNKKYVTNNPISYKTTYSVSISKFTVVKAVFKNADTACTSCTSRLIALTTITWLHCLSLLLRVLVVLGLNTTLKLIRPTSSSSSSSSVGTWSVFKADVITWSLYLTEIFWRTISFAYCSCTLAHNEFQVVFARHCFIVDFVEFVVHLCSQLL